MAANVTIARFCATAVVVWAATLATVQAVERFPPPDFESGHQLPTTAQPPPKAFSEEYADVALLAVLLAAASYFALRRRSRRGVWLTAAFALAYFGFWRQGCVCPIGAIQNVTQGLADPGYVVPLSILAFFLLPLLFTLFFGRTYCAAVCPQGALQDLLALRPVRIPGWIEAGLGFLPHVYLGLAVLFAATGSAYAICRYDPFVAFFRRSGSPEMFLLGAVFVAAGVFIGRPYCRFACPLGALLRGCSRVSRRHVTITPDECIHCRLCEDACPFNAIQIPVPEDLARNRSVGRRRLLVALGVWPVLVAVGAGVGFRVSGSLARNDRTVQLAERVWQEDQGEVGSVSEISAVFRATGQPLDALFKEADRIARRFRIGSTLLGGYLGAVIGGGLVGLAVRRRQPDYVPDQGRCVSCGRCFLYCPIEHKRLKALPARPARPAARGAASA